MVGGHCVGQSLFSCDAWCFIAEASGESLDAGLALVVAAGGAAGGDDDDAPALAAVRGVHGVGLFCSLLRLWVCGVRRSSVWAARLVLGEASRDVLGEKKKDWKGTGRRNIYKRRGREIRQFVPSIPKVLLLFSCLSASHTPPKIYQLFFYKIQNRKSNLRPPTTHAPQNSKSPRLAHAPRSTPDPPLRGPVVGARPAT